MTMPTPSVRIKPAPSHGSLCLKISPYRTGALGEKLLQSQQAIDKARLRTFAVSADEILRLEEEMLYRSVFELLIEGWEGVFIDFNDVLHFMSQVPIVTVDGDDPAAVNRHLAFVDPENHESPFAGKVILKLTCFAHLSLEME